MADVISLKAAAEPKKFTGKHFLIWLLSWFAIVAIANTIMVRAAISTFSGVETESAYRLGLAYNKDLYAGREQAKRGWSVDVALTRGTKGVAVTAKVLDKAQAPVSGLTGSVLLARPTSKGQDSGGMITQAPDGTYTADLGDLAVGQWDVVIEFERDGERLFLSKSRVVLN